MLTVRGIDDNIPEIEEIFDIKLIQAIPGDGLVGSTNYSGASIDPSGQVNNVTLADNDYPYGLLQFTGSLETPQPIRADPWIQPIKQQPTVLSKYV